MRWIVALTLLGCGGPRVVEIRTVEPEKKVQVGPKATAEEAAGEVPPLRTVVQARVLVPERLVPPEPPADPEPVFD